MSKRITVPVELCGFGDPKLNPVCCSETCQLRSECSNHSTAGDFRSESGFAPNLLRERDGSWTCTQEETSCLGALIWCRNRQRYEPYDLYDESQFV